MIREIRKYCTVAVFIFLMLFGAMWYNNVFYQHFHVLSSGSIIGHAHPFSDSGDSNSPVKNHRHTSFELFSIETLQILYFSSLLLFAAFLSLEVFERITEKHSSYPVYYSCKLKSRAPPFQA